MTLWQEIERAAATGRRAEMVGVRKRVDADESVSEHVREMMLGRIDRYLADYDRALEAAHAD